MPQMAPMWWLTLNIMFIITFMIMVTNIYFNMNMKFNKKIYKKMMYVKWMW